MSQLIPKYVQITDDPEQKAKIQLVMNITEKPEDVVATALYDAEWDTNAAVDRLMENEKELLDWKKAGKKKPLKSIMEEKKEESKEVLENNTFSTRKNTGQELPPRMRSGANNNQDNRGRRGRRPDNERRNSNYETNRYDKTGWVRDKQGPIPTNAQWDKPRQASEQADALSVPNSEINQQLESDAYVGMRRGGYNNQGYRGRRGRRFDNERRNSSYETNRYNRTGWVNPRRGHEPTKGQWDEPRQTLGHQDVMPVPNMETNLINQQLESDAYVVGYSGNIESWNPEHSESKVSEEAPLENSEETIPANKCIVGYSVNTESWNAEHSESKESEEHRIEPSEETRPVNECIEDNFISRLNTQCTEVANDSLDKVINSLIIENTEYLKSKNDLGPYCKLPDRQRDQYTQTNNLDSAINKARLPPPTIIADSAVDMPGGFAPRLDIQFGNIDLSTVQRSPSKQPSNTAQSRYVGSLGWSNGLISSANNPPNPGLGLLQKGMISTVSSSSPPMRAQTPLPTINRPQLGSTIASVSSNMSQYYSPIKLNQSRPYVSSVATVPINQSQYTGQMPSYGAWIDAQREHAPITQEIQRDPQWQKKVEEEHKEAQDTALPEDSRLGIPGQNPSAGAVMMPGANTTASGGCQGAVSWDTQHQQLQLAQLAAAAAQNPALAQRYYAQQQQYYAYMYNPQYMHQQSAAQQQYYAHHQITPGYGQGANSNQGAQPPYPGGYGPPQSH